MKSEPKIIEHEPTITTTRGMFTESQYKGMTFEKRDKNGRIKEKPVLCPFTRRKCSEKCALYDAGTCCIISGGQIDPAGACPFADNDQRTTTHTCESCALYTNNACAFILKGQRKRG